MSRRPHFYAVDKKAVRDLLLCDSPRVHLVPVPRHLFHSSKPTVAAVVANAARAVEIDNELVPFLCCAACRSVFTWYKWDSRRQEWVNQSGIAAIRTHVTTCRRRRDNSSVDIVGDFEPPPPPKVPRVSPQLLEELASRVGDLLCDHPSVPVTAAAEFVSCGAEFAADLTFQAKEPFDFHLSGSTLRNHLQRAGEEAQRQLGAYFQAMRRSTGCNVTLATDGDAVLVCGLSDGWDWVCFPLPLDGDLLGMEEPPDRPLFVCAEEESCAMLGGRGVRRCGCCERAVARAVARAMNGAEDSELRAVIDSVEAAAKFLPQNGMIPQVPEGRPWSAWAFRLTALVASYSDLLRQEYLHSLPPIQHLQELRFLIEEVKSILDLLQADGPTAHLPFLLFLQLDVTLQRIKLGLEARATTAMVQRLALQLQHLIGSVPCDDKVAASRGPATPTFWDLCSSGCRLTATFLTGIDLPAKVRQVTAFDSPEQSHEDHSRWQADWTAFADAIEEKVVQFAERLALPLSDPEPCKIEVMAPRSPTQASTSTATSASTFHALFFAPSHVTALRPQELEWAQYSRTKAPTMDPVQFWKNANDMPGLQKLARCVFSIPTSSIQGLCKKTHLQLETDSEIHRQALYIKHLKQVQHMNRGQLDLIGWTGSRTTEG